MGLDGLCGPALPVDTDGTLAANSNTRVPSQKAVKTYVDANGGGGAPLATVAETQAAVASTKAAVPAGLLSNFPDAWRAPSIFDDEDGAPLDTGCQFRDGSNQFNTGGGFPLTVGYGLSDAAGAIPGGAKVTAASMAAVELTASLTVQIAVGSVPAQGASITDNALAIQFTGSPGTTGMNVGDAVTGTGVPAGQYFTATRTAGAGNNVSGTDYGWSNQATPLGYYSNGETAELRPSGGHWVLYDQINQWSLTGPAYTGPYSNPAGAYTGNDDAGAASYTVALNIAVQVASVDSGSQITLNTTVYNPVTYQQPPAKRGSIVVNRGNSPLTVWVCVDPTAQAATWLQVLAAVGNDGSFSNPTSTFVVDSNGDLTITGSLTVATGSGSTIVANNLYMNGPVSMPTAGPLTTSTIGDAATQAFANAISAALGIPTN